MPPQNPLPPLTRRQLLQAAGGITFLALAPNAKGELAPKQRGSAQNPPPFPVFTALPYLQPGTQSSKLIADRESIVIAWQTNGVTANYELEYGVGSALGQSAHISSRHRLKADDEIGEQRINHVATLDDLQLHRPYRYRVRMNGETLLEGYFTTRKPRGAKTRFVAFGDNSCGSISDHAIAYYAYRARPDFVMNAGDNVYSAGLDNEYARYFFPVYNSDAATPRNGAPLLRSVPFYSVMANHDLNNRDAQKRPLVDFSKNDDALGYFTNWHFPLNGIAQPNPTPLTGDAKALGRFLACAGSRFPNMANYSYDYGDAHFLCLDSNVYVDPTNTALQAWIAADLASTDAAWKFVVYHHPAFLVGHGHFDQQHMRVLAPLFEQHGVDVVLTGHEHVYQRCRPLRFSPANEAKAKNVGTSDRIVPGTFSIDRKFDGKTATKPDGVLYITTGAGGNDLYNPELNNNPARWLRKEDNNADYVERFISDRHSLTVFDMDRRSLRLTQIDEWGREIDRCHITKK